MSIDRDATLTREAIARLDDVRARKLAETSKQTDSAELGLCSDDELAERFSKNHPHLRYVAAWNQWLVWDGLKWGRDEKRRVFDFARTTCREALAEHLASGQLRPSQERALKQRLGSAATIWAIVKLASTDPRHAVTTDQLVADPWSLNTPGGIVDLRTNEMRPHDPQALCTKITKASPEGDCPTWTATLERVLPDIEVRGYVQRLVGYGLTGSAREHVSPFGFGHGANGKTTVFGTVRRILGDYALDVPAELLTESHNERHPCELAVLHGARFVIGSEIDTGKRWNESRLKRLTGGDRISARFIGGNPFDFAPSHTLIILANTKPSFRTVDDATRRRVHLIPFDVQIPEAERDPKLPEKLDAEADGILRWALEGCLEWQRQGLNPPAAIRAASEAYLDAEDNIASWLAERCQRIGMLKLTAAHRDYKSWCETSGQPAMGRNAFGDQLEAHGVTKTTDSRSKVVIFQGLSLLESERGHWHED